MKTVTSDELRCELAESHASAIKSVTSDELPRRASLKLTLQQSKA